MGRSADLPRSSGVVEGDDTGCTVLHVDMDAFFASVEVRRRPELSGLPVIVGGRRRGVVAAASYEARRYGVRSAMPIGQALRLCPDAVVLPPDRAAYQQASAQAFAIFADMTPLVEPLSLDEAFLDVAGARRLLGSPTSIAHEIRRRVSDQLQLTCSVGIASNKFLAKLASAACKPDGLRVVPADQILAFLHPLPVAALWGVGQRTGAALYRLGIRTVGDLARAPRDTVIRAVGNAAGQRLCELAWGRDSRAVQPDRAEKSVSAEHTFAEDLTTRAQVGDELARLADELARRLAGRGLAGRTIGIKVRFADFTTVSRVRALRTWTADASTLRRVAGQLYDELGLDRARIRLLGIRSETLRDVGAIAQQLDFASLIGGAPDADTDAGPAAGSDPVRPLLEQARERFGAAAVMPGSAVLRERRSAPDDRGNGE